MNEEERLRMHLERELDLQEHISLAFENIEEKYQQIGPKLKEQLKMLFFKKLQEVTAGKKIAIILVDIQNDFVLSGFSLYVAGGENTVISNMALIDALLEISSEHPELTSRFEVITSQDVHVLGRRLEAPDSIAMSVGLGIAETRALLEEESRELRPFDPEHDQYDLHCMRGTIGSAIPEPLRKKLALLSEQIPTHAFGKINYSGPRSGMKLEDKTDASDSSLLDQDIPIYSHPFLSYAQFFKDKGFHALYMTGICANICVQSAGIDLKNSGEDVHVLDACVHYLIPPGLNLKDLKTHLASLFNVLYTEGFSSNPPQRPTAWRSTINPSLLRHYSIFQDYQARVQESEQETMKPKVA